MIIIIGNFDTQSVETNLQETLMFICMQKKISPEFWYIVKTVQACCFGNLTIPIKKS